MVESVASGFRAELVAALAANTARMCDGLRAELARSVKLKEGWPLQFEVDLYSWGIASCASEEPIITDDWLSRTLTWAWFERAEKAGVDWGALISDELCPWFADCWQAAGGPARFSPAYLFFHDYHNEQYDLEQRRWIPAEEAFGN
jgi:hypothetical protein